MGVIARVAVVAGLMVAMVYSSSRKGQPLAAVAVSALVTIIGVGSAALIEWAQIRRGWRRLVTTRTDLSAASPAVPGVSGHRLRDDGLGLDGWSGI